MAAKMVRFHHQDGSKHLEPMARFAAANGTDIRGAKAILAYWESKRHITRRKDGGFDVHRRMPRQDPATMNYLRSNGFKAPKPKIEGQHPTHIFMDEAAEFPGA